MNLAEIATQLDSADSRDRLIALASLRPVEPAEAVPLIKKVINDENLQVRAMAVFALGVKPQPECLDLLTPILEGDSDYSIRAAAAGALGYLADNRALSVLLRAFYEDTEWVVRFSAAVSLGNLQDSRARTALMEALKSDEPLMQQAAIAALGEIGAVDSVDELLQFAGSSDWLVRQHLAEALGNLPVEKSLSALRYLAKDSHPQVAEAAELALQRLLQHPDWQSEGRDAFPK